MGTEMFGDGGGGMWRQRWRYVETEVEICGDRGGGMWRWRQRYAEMEAEVCEMSLTAHRCQQQAFSEQ
jgi:hypothetical protein